MPQAKRLMQEEASTPASQRAHEAYVERPEVVRERWDCESVLSLRSNLDNHPASISEPTSSRRPRQQVMKHACRLRSPEQRSSGVYVM